jgi:hypothetical protein
LSQARVTADLQIAVYAATAAGSVEADALALLAAVGLQNFAS